MGGCEKGERDAQDQSAQGAGDRRDPAESRTTADTPGELAEVVESRREHTQDMADCLSESGFPVSLTDDGGLEISQVPQEQRAGLDAALEACLEKVGRPRARVPPKPNCPPSTT